MIPLFYMPLGPLVTTTSRILDVCDAAKAHLESVWGPGVATVTRTYVPTFDDNLTGKRVYIIPDPDLARRQLDVADRGEDTIAYTFWVVLFERYTSQGQPPDSWTDARVAFMENSIIEVLTDIRNLTLLSGACWPEEERLETLFEPGMLSEDGWYWGAAAFTFAEVADG